MTIKITATMKAALIRAAETGNAKASNHYKHVAMLWTMIEAGMLTKRFKITAAGRKAAGIKAAAPVKPVQFKRRCAVQLEGLVPASRATIPSYPISYARH